MSRMSISRRAFLGGLAGVTAASAGVFAKAPVVRRGFERTQALRIDAQKLRERIEALSVFGRPAGGSFASGVSRVAYSDADVAGRQYVMDLMRKAGLEPRIDPAGNVFAR